MTKIFVNPEHYSDNDSEISDKDNISYTVEDRIIYSVDLMTEKPLPDVIDTPTKNIFPNCNKPA